MNISTTLVQIVAAPLGLIVLDAVLGVALAVKNKTFTLQKLPSVVENSLAPVGTGLGIGVLVQSVLNGGGATAVAAGVAALAASVAARSLSDIKTKVATLLS